MTDRPPRVLVLVKGLGLGGAETLIVDQARAAAAAGLEVSVAYVRPDKTHFVGDLDDAGVPTHVLGRAGSGRPWPWALARLLRTEGPDVVHSHSPLPAAVARVLVRLGVAGRGVAHVATEHNRWHSHRAPTRLANAATLALDARTWAVSAEARDSVGPAALRRRVQTLHHGVDLDAIRRRASQPTAALPERDVGDVVLVQVANRRPNKAHEVMLEAFAHAAADVSNLRLWLVGQWLDTDEFTALVAAHPARAQISVLGYRGDAPAVLAAGDALVLSSLHEGLPVAVMEAYALGRPVVATAVGGHRAGRGGLPPRRRRPPAGPRPQSPPPVGGLPEAVDDGVEGLLVPPGDPRALAAAMVRVATEPGLREELGGAAARRAADFDARRAHEEMAGTYRLVAGRRVRTARGRRRSAPAR